LTKLLDRLTPKHLEILQARGIEGETLARHGVVSSARSDGDWIGIPYVSDGRVVNHKYRTIAGDKRFYQDAGTPKQFWNLDVLKDASLKDHPVIITEGEMDAMIAIQSGFPRTLSVPDGAPPEAIGENPDSRKYTFVEDARRLLADVREIILATDGDGPGVNLMNDLAIRLGKARCKFVRYPKETKDFNEAFLKYGQKAISAIVARAEWCRVDGIYRMSQLPPVTDLKLHTLGMPVMDDHYRLRLTDFCLVTGIPSHGKSAWITEIGCRMVKRHDWTVAFASFEQQPQRDFRRNLRTYYHSKRVVYQSPEEIDEADGWIDRHFSFIVPNEDDDVNLEWVLDRARASVVQHGANMVAIDPWNEMDHSRPRDMSLTEYTGFAIKEFKRLARSMNIHLIVAAHPAKQQRREDGTFQIPSLYDVSDSAHWYNKPEVGMVVHRENKDRTVIRIAKSRYHDQIGTPGDVNVSFSTETNHYTVLEDQH
jgi:twinkle protein